MLYCRAHTHKWSRIAREVTKYNSVVPSEKPISIDKACVETPVPRKDIEKYHQITSSSKGFNGGSVRQICAVAAFHVLKE